MLLIKFVFCIVVDFDEQIDCVGIVCLKWDDMQKYYGVDLVDGILMWVVDMDFCLFVVVQNVVEVVVWYGIYGYLGGNVVYIDVICWWMQYCYGWQVQFDWIMMVYGLVNGMVLCVDVFIQLGDVVVLMILVYYGFVWVICVNGCDVMEFFLVQVEGEYCMDWEGWVVLMIGCEWMLVLCLLYNFGGWVWFEVELW